MYDFLCYNGFKLKKHEVHMSYIEIRQRGTADFPIELYCLNSGADRYEMVPHWHSELEIIRIISGTLHIRLNNNIYDVCSVFTYKSTY